MHFKKKSKAPPAFNRLAERMAAALLSVQRIFARRMNGLTKNLSRRLLKLCLLFFAGGWFALSAGIIVDALQHPPPKGDVAVTRWVTRFQAPVLLPVPARPKRVRGPDAVTKFMGYLDSLQRFDPARYDSLVHTRPGLLDSIDKLMNMDTRFKKIQ